MLAGFHLPALSLLTTPARLPDFAALYGANCQQMPILDHSLKFREGPVGLLLIHALAGTPAELRSVALGLAKAGYTVHCPQLPGHGGSYADLRATGWRDWYATVEKQHGQLRKICRRVIVGGLSMGALLALHLAAKRPNDVHATVLFAPTLKLDGWGAPWYSVLFNLVRVGWGGDRFLFSEQQSYAIKDPRLRALVASASHGGDSSKIGQLPHPGRVMLEMRGLVRMVQRELRDIRQPALIVHPRNDDRTGLRNVTYLQRKLGGLVETCSLQDRVHVITLDRQRDLVVQRTAAFVARIDTLQNRNEEKELADLANMLRPGKSSK